MSWLLPEFLDINEKLLLIPNLFGQLCIDTNKAHGEDLSHRLHKRRLGTHAYAQSAQRNSRPVAIDVEVASLQWIHLQM
jgi:hypothetical protein